MLLSLLDFFMLKWYRQKVNINRQAGLAIFLFSAEKERRGK